jgi:hypothetical protein
VGGAFTVAERSAAGRAVAAVLCRRCLEKNWPEGWTSCRLEPGTTNYDVSRASAVARAAAVALYLLQEGFVDANAATDGEIAWQALRSICSDDKKLADEIGKSWPDLKNMLGDTTFHPARDTSGGWLTRLVTLVRWAASLGRRRGGPPAPVLDPDPWMPGTSPPADPAERAVLASLLTAYTTQFGSYTTLLWQVPALSLTAQSFLLIIVLTAGNGHFAKLTAAVLSIVIALASTRLMHDQRGHAMNHGELALRISRQLRLGSTLGNLQIEDAEPAGADAETVWVSWDHRIYHTWTWALYLFILVDVVALVATIVSLAEHHL